MEKTNKLNAYAHTLALVAVGCARTSDRFGYSARMGALDGSGWQPRRAVSHSLSRGTWRQGPGTVSTKLGKARKLARSGKARAVACDICGARAGQRCALWAR